MNITDTFSDVLAELARNNGACLYWQMPNPNRAKLAQAAGTIKSDGDLLVHPDAIKVSEGGYRMGHPEFADYPMTDLPPMPQGFADSSWHNDTCPSYLDETSGLRIFMDYIDPAKRESGEAGPRFHVGREDADGAYEEILGSNDWAEVLAFVATQPKTNAATMKADCAEIAEAFNFMYAAAMAINAVLSRNDELNGSVPTNWPLPLSADEFAAECSGMAEHYSDLAK